MTLLSSLSPIIVPVALAERAYDILIAPGILADLGALVAPLAARGFVAIVTDATVAPLLLEPVQQSLHQAGLTSIAIQIPAGESAKTLATWQGVLEELIAAGVERSDVILALGGGVVGDLTGFAAAVLRRGCRLVQVPTTLLAQVDSSVGGKTAINSPAGKNLIGAFYQPHQVMIDPNTLQTLPIRELRSGYAEIVKYGLINDAPFFEWLEAQGEAVLAQNPAALTHAIATSCMAKARIVAQDERETSDVRALLNLGHTFAHALEAEAHYDDRIRHGEAVAIGLCLAFQLSVHLGLCAEGDALRVQAHLTRMGLPTNPASLGLFCTPKALISHMQQDKKRSAGVLPFILARGIGQAFVCRDVPMAAVQALLETQLSNNEEIG